MTITKASKEMIWLQNFLEELGVKCEKGTLYNDSQSVIYLAKNPVFHSRMKHIHIRYHFIRPLLEEVLWLVKIAGVKNLADIFTKRVTTKKLKLCSIVVELHG